MWTARLSELGIKPKVSFAAKPLAAAAGPKPKFVYVLGGPGCGKGTNCARLKEEFGFVHLSAGDLLRAEQKREGSAEAKLIAEYIKEGKIVPAEITITLLRRAMEATPEATFLIDGFPRKLDQAAMFEKAVRTEPKFVLFFDVSKEVMTDRIIERGRTSGRSDDNMEALIKRFDTYQNTSFPVIEHFKQRKLVERVDAAGAKDAVYKAAKDLFVNPKISFLHFNDVYEIEVSSKPPFGPTARKLGIG